MLVNAKVRDLYERIQKQLFYMLPEKWDRVYLYASVIDHYNNVQTGEMFFYYYPKSVLKKNPINVYEIPSKFNIDETAYLKLAENLYTDIKKLRTTLIKIGEKAWSNLTISIQNFKFTIEYNYDDLLNSKYTNSDRHLIWRYKYLNIPLSSYSKKDRKMLEKYLLEEEYKNKNVTTYNEGIYEMPVSKIVEYNKQEIEKTEETDNTKKQEIKDTVEKKDYLADECKHIKSQILNIATD